MKTNVVIQGDCLEEMQNIPNGCIDMILCDLPYGTTACSWDTIIPFEPLWKAYKRIIKPNGAIALTASQPFTSALVMSNLKMFKCCWVWDKVKPSTGLHAKIMPLRRTEDVVVFGNKKINYFPQLNKTSFRLDKPRMANNGEAFGGKSTLRQHSNDGVKYPTNLITLSNANQNNRYHPTQKPVDLMKYLIQTYTNAGDLVLDNCAGSGTTGVAAKLLNRKYILIEKEPKYVAICNERLKQEVLAL